jgi:DeoR family fructose operon transcriptional repressor
MIAQERRQRITEIVQQKGTISTKELSEMLSVSEMTIRRDLDYLNKQSSIVKHFGGASDRSVYVISGTDFSKRLSDHDAEKRTIAAKAQELISEGESIFLDHATSCIYLARELAHFSDLTVITYSIPIIQELQKTRVKVIGIGGILLQPNECFIGPLAEEMISRFHGNKVFLGAQGIDMDKGLSIADLFEVNMKLLMADRSDEVIVLADHTKFQKHGLYPNVPIQKINTIITDGATDAELIRQGEERNIRMIVA